MTPSGEHFTGSVTVYVGYVLTAQLNDDLGKWVRGARRDSELKNVYLRLAELQYVTERRCQGRAQDKCRAGILAFSLCWDFSDFLTAAETGHCHEAKHVRACVFLLGRAGADTHRETGITQL